ncbi:MAG: DUF4369 domain-containing protein [Bacteroidaceae bacterium]|nr:DUF4369 domain-containing protein [Bacteroidaceae bacterium]
MTKTLRCLLLSLQLMMVAGLVLCSCSDKKSTFTLKGRLSAVKSDTLLIYGADDWYDSLDSVAIRNGRFTYKAKVDTVTPLWLAFSNGYRTMLLAEKNTVTTLLGDVPADGHFFLKGGTQNTILQEFNSLIQDTTLSSNDILSLADSFITCHPFDEASIVLLRKYFVDVPEPSYSKIKHLIGSMSGTLQDNNYLVSLNIAMEALKSNAVNAARYTLHDTINKVITPTLFADSCVLVTFWASYDEKSRERQREYRALVDTFSGRPFKILSVSLDLNREAWLKAIREDSTTTWCQTNDFAGWTLDLVRQMGVKELPWNVLTNAQRRISSTNLYGDSLRMKIHEVVKQEEDRKKAEEEKKKEEERKNKNKKKK